MPCKCTFGYVCRTHSVKCSDFVNVGGKLFSLLWVERHSKERALYKASPRELSFTWLFTWWWCRGLCFWHKPTELAHSILFCSCVYFCLYGPFSCTSFPKFSLQLSAFSVCSYGLISALMVLSSICISPWKKSLSPDKILCGWLGLKHQLTD